MCLNARSMLLKNFLKAEKQLALLREEQKAVYNGKTFALTLSVIARWEM